MPGSLMVSTFSFRRPGTASIYTPHAGLALACSSSEAVTLTRTVVFTGIGALCWLPDVRRWAQETKLPDGRRVAYATNREAVATDTNVDPFTGRDCSLCERLYPNSER